MPVDLVATAVVELAEVGKADISSATSAVYNVQNKKLFHWTRDFLPALKLAGLVFKTVPQREWVAMLRQSNPDPETNPTIKLVDFFADKYDNDGPGRSGLAFSTEKGEKKSEALRKGFDVISQGLVLKMVRWWQTQW